MTLYFFPLLAVFTIAISIYMLSDYFFFVPKTKADLGLTAIPSTEVLDIMSRDFYDKYDEYMAVSAERKDRSLRQTAYSTAVTVERNQLANFIEKAVQETADWNKKMNQERLVYVVNQFLTLVLLTVF